MQREPAENSAKNIHEILRSRAEEFGGKISFRDFSKIALFEPRLGYYRKNAERVGRRAGTDFYTAASFGETFGKLVRAAAETLVGETRDFSLVEIGAEPGQTHFSAQQNFFKELRTIRVGEPIDIGGNAIVVANELLDAQPFYRLVSLAGTWREIGVEENPNERNSWQETLLEDFSSEEIAQFASETRVPADDGWHLDISLDAENLLRKILRKNWKGAAIFFDYGKTLADCLETFPEGTARAYFRHTQTNALTRAPGEQDLTCHVLWDRLERVFEECGFRTGRPMRQERFFMKFSLPEIEKIITGTSAESARERGILTELIHPAKMGHAFQALAGVRV